MAEVEPTLSVIVPTRDRAESLRHLLASLDRLNPPSVPFEIVIADNGSTDETPRLLAEWRAAAPARVVVRVNEQGKSRALNAAITASRGQLLAFLDDDVEVDPAWLAEVWEYFTRRDVVAAQGSVLWPDEATSDPELYALLDRYRTIVHLDLDNDAPRTKLTGANMAVRRHTLGVVGVFNEKLGPGAAGLSEDNELADRIRAHGGRIGYMSKARVTHEIDRSRLTEEYFREYHRRQGRSRFAYKHNGIATSILPNLVKAIFSYVVYSAIGNVRKQYRAKGRYYHYREMLDLALKGRPAGPASLRA
ncbi:MAG TPA: glycosyltransferase family 2 protein [Candidatus Bathyarchaeia archaeon]|nr:glycosyltransferase family 2 protein [Candidatus Bathyarchaeia archaeon]